MAKAKTEKKTKDTEEEVPDKNGHAKVAEKDTDGEPDEKVAEETEADEKAQENGDAKPDEKADENEETEADEKAQENGDAKPDEKADKNGDAKEKEGSDEESSSDEEPQLGLLDKPVVVTTKRERKGTERFSTDKVKTDADKEEDELDFTTGKGIKIGDIEYVRHMIHRADSEDLTVIHRLMYLKGRFKMTTIKRNIRAFCGYPFDKDSEYYKKVLNIAERLTIPGLRWIVGIFGFEKTQDREVMTNQLLDYFMEPKDMEIPIPVKTPKPKKKKKIGRGPGKRTPSRSAKSKKKTAAASQDDDDDEDGSDVSSASDDSGSEGEEEEKPKKTPSKKPSSEKKSSAKKKKPTAVKIPVPSRKSKTPKRKAAESDSSSEDEPLVKKSKNPPSNPELKKVISAILKDVDLEEVTMKSVVRQVYDKFPGFDLTHKKDFIKSSVKELIS